MIGLISINHKTASLSRRDQFAFSPEEARYLIDEWRRAGYILGGLVLSTCNRLEVYYDCDEAITREHEERLIRSLYDFKRVRTRGDEGIFVTQHHEAAIRHLLRLSSGLESMVQGETQILGQLKDAFRRAKDQEQTTSFLTRLMHKAFETAKGVRSQYLVSATPISAGAAAVDFLARRDPDYLQRPILILGAGQMAEVITERLQQLGASHIHLYNRTKERGEVFARRHGLERLFSGDQLREALTGAEVTFVATSSQSPIITEGLLDHTAGRRTFFDMAVPRNVDPAVDEDHSIRLYTIDDLRGAQLLEAQDPEAAAALSAYIDTMISEYITWCEASEVRKVIGRIQETSQQLLMRELSRLPSELPEEHRQLVAHWDEHLRITYTTAIVSALRELSEEAGHSRYASALHHIFTHIQDKLHDEA